MSFEPIIDGIRLTYHSSGQICKGLAEFLGLVLNLGLMLGLIWELVMNHELVVVKTYYSVK